MPQGEAAEKEEELGEEYRTFHLQCYIIAVASTSVEGEGATRSLSTGGECRRGETEV